jgi:hypothetical protein
LDCSLPFFIISHTIFSFPVPPFFPFSLPLGNNDSDDDDDDENNDKSAPITADSLANDIIARAAIEASEEQERYRKMALEWNLGHVAAKVKDDVVKGGGKEQQKKKKKWKGNDMSKVNENNNSVFNAGLLNAMKKAASTQQGDGEGEGEEQLSATISKSKKKKKKAAAAASDSEDDEVMQLTSEFQ